MPLEIVYGESRNKGAARDLASRLRDVVESGTVYLGYPVLATADEKVEVDALLVSRDRGLVAFLLADSVPHEPAEWANFIEQQDRLYTVLDSHLGRYNGLRRGRGLAVTPQTATVFPTAPAGLPANADGFYGDLDAVQDWARSLPGLEETVERALQAALQRVTTIKPPKPRNSVTQSSSRGAVMKQIEREIANLDQWQKTAAIESPEGPQRIRGLAGSGKTVTLALKAAYWHTQHPDWRIALTFYSQSLHQQIDDLVTRFTFEHNNDRPTANLQIIHAWGSSNAAGVYSTIASALGETPRDWAYAKGKYGYDDAFRGVCQELLEISGRSTVAPLFDAVLIDEAQDLPLEFFRLVYRFTEEPKRIVWGYDELQKLSESAMPTTAELFGISEDGEPLVSLENHPDTPRRDIVLPVCYRNTPWALATAHAIGIGVYRAETGLLQHPDDPGVWQEIGYDVLHGSLEPGSRVTLERSSGSYPSYFPSLIDRSDAVVFEVFEDQEHQDAWVAGEIARNLSTDELDIDDILVVLPDAYTSKSRAPRLIRELARHNIPAHLAGVNTRVDVVFRPDSVAIAHIFRAKGNEAPMVYAVDAQYATHSVNIVTRRNTLFTAITRSRGWVRVTGHGDRARQIAAEMAQVRDNQYRLAFQVPTAAELANLRHIHRDRPIEHEKTLRRATQSLSTFLSALEKGDIDFVDLPPELRARLEGLRDEAIGDDNG